MDEKLCNELVDRVAASDQFRKSARTRELLRYLANLALKSPGEVHEQEIGAAIFGRPPDYDTSADNIVRVAAYELRKRLETYFSKDGLAESIVIEIPKGSYCLAFTPRKSAPSVESQAQVFNIIALRKALKTYAVAALCLVLAIACGTLLVRNAELNGRLAGPKPSPSLQRLWSRMFSEGRTTDVVVADSIHGLMQDALRRAVPIKEYSNSGNLPKSLETAITPGNRSLFEYMMTQRYTSLADVHTLQRLFLLSTSDARRLSIHFARDFSVESLKSSNVVLIGSKKANPWCELFEGSQNFTFAYDQQNGSVVIVNKQPKPGEQERYGTTVRPPTSGSYGVVAFIPNLSHSGNVLIISGAGVASTEAAGELVTNEDLLSQLIRTMGVAPDAGLPYFEVLLKTTVMGAAMQAPEIVSWHIRPGLEKTR